MREVCHTLQTVSKTKFDDANYTIVAGFYFLRYICPAIVAPPSYGLLDTCATRFFFFFWIALLTDCTARFPKKESHRGLVLIAKALQNLANGAKFGAKESHMAPLNETLGVYEDRFECRLGVLLSSDPCCTASRRSSTSSRAHARAAPRWRRPP